MASRTSSCICYLLLVLCSVHVVYVSCEENATSNCSNCSSAVEIAASGVGGFIVGILLGIASTGLLIFCIRKSQIGLSEGVHSDIAATRFIRDKSRRDKFRREPTEYSTQPRTGTINDSIDHESDQIRVNIDAKEDDDDYEDELTICRKEDMMEEEEDVEGKKAPIQLKVSKGRLPVVPPPSTRPPRPPSQVYDLPYVTSATKPSETPLEEYDYPEQNLSSTAPLCKSQILKQERTGMIKKPLSSARSVGQLDVCISEKPEQSTSTEHYYVMDPPTSPDQLVTRMSPTSDLFNIGTWGSSSSLSSQGRAKGKAPKPPNKPKKSKSIARTRVPMRPPISSTKTPVTSSSGQPPPPTGPPPPLVPPSVNNVSPVLKQLPAVPMKPKSNISRTPSNLQPQKQRSHTHIGHTQESKDEYGNIETSKRHVMNFELASNLKDRQIHKQEKMGAVNTIAVQKNSTHEYANIHRKTHTQRN